jgi:hypothetical protein
MLDFDSFACLDCFLGAATWNETGTTNVLVAHYNVKAQATIFPLAQLGTCGIGANRMASLTQRFPGG